MKIPSQRSELPVPSGVEVSDPAPLVASVSFLSLAFSVSSLSLASFFLFSSFYLLPDLIFLLPSARPIYLEYLQVPVISAYSDLTDQCRLHFLLLSLLFRTMQDHLPHPHHLPQKEYVIIFSGNFLFSACLPCHLA